MRAWMDGYCLYFFSLITNLTGVYANIKPIYPSTCHLGVPHVRTRPEHHMVGDLWLYTSITSAFYPHMAVCQNLVPLVNIKIAGKWMFIPLKMVLIGIDPYPYDGWFPPFLLVNSITQGFLSGGTSGLGKVAASSPARWTRRKPQSPRCQRWHGIWMDVSFIDELWHTVILGQRFQNPWSSVNLTQSFVNYYGHMENFTDKAHLDPFGGFTVYSLVMRIQMAKWFSREYDWDWDPTWHPQGGPSNSCCMEGTPLFLPWI